MSLLRVEIQIVIVAVILGNLLWSCSVGPPPAAPAEPMFGIPGKRTGVCCEQCRPYCESLGFHSRIFTAEELQDLRSWTLTQPYALLQRNPYKQPVPERPQGVCAVVIEDLAEKKYHLATFPDEESARAAGAILTHHDACGLCSTLQDLSVYASNPDLGLAVKRCVMRHLFGSFDKLYDCILSLGFSEPCAQIWAYNARQTRRKLTFACLFSMHYNKKDGRLKRCLQRDEEISGPVFKAVAGRTRRNTGIANSICRPCSEVRPVTHDYPRSSP
ncbi:MAG: hypothetical protein KatS3mg031_0870 [Chitinophagales bacterium]|nr:MAG: hypothetical protein KatS3mg031_0870 [Chitinophagales bacterium]